MKLSCRHNVLKSGAQHLCCQQFIASQVVEQPQG